jgi:ABC-type transport system involved in Fe-S cluster assembly fused permease/ATPase subunit
MKLQSTKILIVLAIVALHACQTSDQTTTITPQRNANSNARVASNSSTNSADVYLFLAVRRKNAPQTTYQYLLDKYPQCQAIFKYKDGRFIGIMSNVVMPPNAQGVKDRQVTIGLFADSDMIAIDPTIPSNNKSSTPFLPQPEGGLATFLEWFNR